MIKLFRIISLLWISLLQFSCDREVPVSAPEPQVSIVSCTLLEDGKLSIQLEGENCDKMFAAALTEDALAPTSGWVRFNGTEAKNGRVIISDLLPGKHIVYAVSIKDGDKVIVSQIAKAEVNIPFPGTGGQPDNGGSPGEGDSGEGDSDDNPGTGDDPVNPDTGLNNTSIPFFADLDLIPGGSLAKEPKYWDEARYLPHVTYRESNNSERWLHEAFLLIDGQVNGKLMSIDNGAESANQSDWTQFINYWFGQGQAVAVLDQTIEKAISRIGAPSFCKHKIVMTMPDPIMLQNFSNKSSSTKYWGKIDGRQLDFSTPADQILAYMWFIEQVRTAWEKLAPKHLQLAGFYILSEILVAKPSGYNYAYKKWDQILPSVSSYLHGMNYGLYWIPYYKADGYDMTGQLGIDYTWLQPNAYWDYPEKEQKKDWKWVFSTMNTYGHGMEIEFEGSHGEGGWSQYEEGVKRTSSSILSTVRTSGEAEGRKPGEANPYAARNRQLLRDYMNNFKEAGYYGTARIATYSGTNAMYELGTSNDENDKQMYLEYCRFIVNSPLRK